MKSRFQYSQEDKKYNTCSKESDKFSWSQFTANAEISKEEKENKQSNVQIKENNITDEPNEHSESKPAERRYSKQAYNPRGRGYVGRGRGGYQNRFNYENNNVRQSNRGNDSNSHTGNLGRRGRGGNQNRYEFKAEPKYESNDERVKFFSKGPVTEKEFKYTYNTMRKEQVPQEFQEQINELNQEIKKLGKIEKPNKKELDQRVNFYEGEIDKLSSEIKVGKDTIKSMIISISKTKEKNISNIQKKKALTSSLSTAKRLINKNYQEISDIDNRLTKLKARHVELAKQFKIRSFSEIQTRISEIEDQIQSGEYNNLAQLHKKLGNINKYQRKGMYHYQEMDENEEEQARLLEQKIDIYQQIKQLKEEKTSLIQEINDVEEEITNSKDFLIEQPPKIDIIKNDIKEKEEQLNAKKERVTKIIEQFYRLFDLYETKMESYCKIEEQKEKILKSAKK